MASRRPKPPRATSRVPPARAAVIPPPRPSGRNPHSESDALESPEQNPSADVTENPTNPTPADQTLQEIPAEPVQPTESDPPQATEDAAQPLAIQLAQAQAVQAPPAPATTDPQQPAQDADAKSDSPPAPAKPATNIPLPSAAARPRVDYADSRVRNPDPSAAAPSGQPASATTRPDEMTGAEAQPQPEMQTASEPTPPATPPDRSKPTVSALGATRVHEDKPAVEPRPSTAAPAAAVRPVASALPEVVQALAGQETSDEGSALPSGLAKSPAQASAVVPTEVPLAKTLQQSASASPAAVAAPVPPEQQFAEANHASIVTSVRSQLLPNGGTMQIRLDPPELGALQVSVQMRDGMMTASFQTSNDDATKLLSHSLNQLKTALESQGVIVDKIHVQQAPREQTAGNSEDQQRQQQQDDASGRQEQQRKEMLRRMWQRLSKGRDPLDLLG